MLSSSIKLHLHWLRIAVRNFGPPYINSYKQLDQGIIPPNQVIPTVVVEAGWLESVPKLYQDKSLWLRGGVGFVQVVLLIKWTQITGNRVKGFIEVYDLDPAGNERLLQNEVIIQQSNIFQLVADGIRLFSQHRTMPQLKSLPLPEGSYSGPQYSLVEIQTIPLTSRSTIFGQSLLGVYRVRDLSRHRWCRMAVDSWGVIMSE